MGITYLPFGNEILHSGLNKCIKSGALTLLGNDALHQLSFTLTRQYGYNKKQKTKTLTLEITSLAAQTDQTTFLLRVQDTLEFVLTCNMDQIIPFLLKRVTITVKSLVGLRIEPNKSSPVLPWILDDPFILLQTTPHFLQFLIQLLTCMSLSKDLQNTMQFAASISLKEVKRSNKLAYCRGYQNKFCSDTAGVSNRRVFHH